jgi:CheY-like chemotaxis protein
MLALEEVYDITMVKDGQEAFDTVKLSMEKGLVFDLIFMDIQVSCLPRPRRLCVLSISDAKPGWPAEHPTHP